MSATTEADDLVTEEIEERAKRVFGSPNSIEAEQLIAALRAVAPMIAARLSYDDKLRTCERAVAAEREACAKIVEGYERYAFVTGQIAAAIRARGETP
jgi:hypothetical protein